MKAVVACLLLGLSVGLTHAGEGVLRLIFPPFATEDLKIPDKPIQDNITDDELKAMSANDLRGYMTYGNYQDQDKATKELLSRSDQETIIRIVYSVKQGNIMAKAIIDKSNSLALIPYLMEDVAHGSLDYYGGYSFGDCGYSGGRVRQDAVEMVSSILHIATEFTAPKFSAEALESMKAIGRGYTNRVVNLSEESRYLIQWWHLNEKAFEAKKWDQIRPLAQEITYVNPKNDVFISSDRDWDSTKQPPFGSPVWELPESFEAWSKRIVHPELRNLDFVALSWDGQKVVEHPAKSIDPRRSGTTGTDREPRRSSVGRNAEVQNFGDGLTGWIWRLPWFVWCIMVIVMAGLFRLVINRKAL